MLRLNASRSLSHEVSVISVANRCARCSMNRRAATPLTSKAISRPRSASASAPKSATISLSSGRAASRDAFTHFGLLNISLVKSSATALALRPLSLSSTLSRCRMKSNPTASAIFPSHGSERSSNCRMIRRCSVPPYSIVRLNERSPSSVSSSGSGSSSSWPPCKNAAGIGAGFSALFWATSTGVYPSGTHHTSPQGTASSPCSALHSLIVTAPLLICPSARVHASVAPSCNTSISEVSNSNESACPGNMGENFSRNSSAMNACSGIMVNTQIAFCAASTFSYVRWPPTRSRGTPDARHMSSSDQPRSSRNVASFGDMVLASHSTRCRNTPNRRPSPAPVNLRLRSSVIASRCSVVQSARSFSGMRNPPAVSPRLNIDRFSCIAALAVSAARRAAARLPNPLNSSLMFGRGIHTTSVGANVIGSPPPAGS